jgi:hypothetical protein
MRTLVLAAMLIAASSLAQAQGSQAQDWGTAARQCGAQYAQWWLETHGYRCASCSGGWPVIARCTAATVDPQISPDVVEACIRMELVAGFQQRWR